MRIDSARVDLKAAELRARAGALAKQPRARKAAIWLASIVAAIGVIGALIAPPLLRQKLAGELSRMLHREVSIRQIRINPYAMSARIRGFLMKERRGGGTAVSFDELYVNLQLSSVFRRGPVLKEIRLVKPYVHLVRDEDWTYNFTDLIEEFTKGPPGPTPRFSLNNIEIIDGRVDFDDRPEGAKHAVTSIRIGVPFLSSLPVYTDITVQPSFSALVNGSPFEIRGETKPFKNSRESVIRLAIDKLRIPTYLEYSPVALNFAAPSGELNGKLSVSFKTAKDSAAALSISGKLGLKDLALQGKDDSPILTLPALDVELDAIELFANKAALKTVRATGPELHLTRNQDGSLSLASLVVTQAEGNGSEREADPKRDATPFAYRVDEIVLDGGKLYVTDRVPRRPFQARIDDIRIGVKGLSSEPNKKAEVEVSFQTAAKERFHHGGTLQLTPLVAEGAVELEKVQLKNFRAYYESVSGPELEDGLIDLAANFYFARREEALDIQFSGVQAALRSLDLNVPGEVRSRWRIPLMEVKDAAVDVGKKSVVIGAFEGRDGSGVIQREPAGAAIQEKPATARAVESPKTSKPEEDWRLDAKRLSLNRFKVAFEDRSRGAPARILVSELSARGENFSNAKNARGRATVQAKINSKGTIKLAGTAGLNPVSAQFDVQAQEIELLPFQPYVTDQVNFQVTGGAMGTSGKVALQMRDDGSPMLSYEGSLRLQDFGAVDKPDGADLLKWKSLTFSGVRLSTEPVRLEVGEISLADFYSRVILAADGSINLQQLAVRKQKAPQPSVSGQPPQPAGAVAPAPPRVTIGKVNLQGGNVEFSDFFVKPNYSANLTGLQGFVSELKPETPGDLQIQASIDQAAPVEIAGKINPLGKELFLDIRAKASDIELNPLTSYSAKYVGYGIEKGKLSLDIRYRLENRALSAQNKIILNQLTFGERIESPTATRLPVLLAVSLLKDRNGVIAVDLPISGSLDSPEFSVGGIVLRIILNIITRAVTSPFTLLSSAFGGGEELSYVEFEHGRATITPAAEARLKTLATALNNRPGLRLEITGRADPVHDSEALKRLAIERKVKAQKMKEQSGREAALEPADDVQFQSDEYRRLLWAVYKQEDFPKERNLIGLVKEQPVPEMEKLLLQHAKVTDADLRELARRRTEAVRSYFLTTGKLGSERIFLVASSAAGKDSKGSGGRVDFSLK